MITVEKREEDRGSTRVSVGLHVLAIITPETPQDCVAKFIKLCQENEHVLDPIGVEYEEKRQWNYDSKGKGKNWPVFTKRDRIVSRLAKEAGIVDT